MSAIIEQVRQTLSAGADEQLREQGKRFFKEDELTPSYGYKTTEVTKIAKTYFEQIKTLPKAEIFDLCTELWQSGMLEESFIACTWSYALHKSYEPEDLNVFAGWLHNHVNNWASCDTLCNHNIGDIAMMYTGSISQIKGWAVSENRWARRGAAVSLIIPARKGLFLADIFEIADSLLPDADHMVQKGYGWMLKAASEAYPMEVFDYVVAKKAVMPRTAYRYALEKMPKEMRAEAMKK